ncbi:MAG: carboxypeptidase-like regulatory domain-containing protein, partial [Cyclobacteriaceae bacterium]|nr:carboxypeptidase-like regulatory domain-containing protein [Cyclobacteriaceae bacterium]
MKKITLFLIVILLSASRFADVKEIKISGTILSGADGAPLPGVNIFEKGTLNGTISDQNGKYKIAVKNESSVLEFSSIGFITEEITV